jgi:hypothetical protein
MRGEAVDPVQMLVAELVIRDSAGPPPS